MRFICVFFGLALLLAAPVRAEELVVTGSARVAIQGGRSLDARGQALNKALDEALTKAVARVLEVDRDDLSVEQLDLIETKLLPARKDYQDKYEILEEGAESDGANFKLRARVTFIGDKLRDALMQLGLAKRARTWERVMIMVPERHLTRYIPDPAAETDIIRTDRKSVV